MKRLIIFSVVTLFSWQILASDHCSTWLKNNPDKTLTDFIEININKFQDELATANMPKYKKKILEKLWMPEIKKGRYTIVNFRQNTKAKAQSEIYLLRPQMEEYSINTILTLRPYAASLPGDLANSFIQLAKQNGLKHGADYVTIPLKMMATNLTEHWVKHSLFLVLSLGVGGVILDRLGILAYDPVFNDFKPEELGPNEVAAFLLFDPEQRRGDYNSASLTDWYAVKSYEEDYPDKAVLIRVTKDLTATELNQQLAGRKIKQLFFSAHGSPGNIYSEFHRQSFQLGATEYEDESLNALLKKLQLEDHLSSDELEVYFTSCNLAGSTQAREDVNYFAEHLIPGTGFIKTNRITGTAGATGTIEQPWNLTSVAQHGTTAINPVAGTFIHALFATMQRARDFEHFFQPATYTYKKEAP